MCIMLMAIKLKDIKKYLVFSFGLYAESVPSLVIEIMCTYKLYPKMVIMLDINFLVLRSKQKYHLA